MPPQAPDTVDDQVRRLVRDPGFVGANVDDQDRLVSHFLPGFPSLNPDEKQAVLDHYGFSSAPSAQQPGAMPPGPPPPADVVDPKTQQYYARHAPISFGERATNELLANAPMIGGTVLPMTAYALAPATGGLSLVGAAALGGLGGRWLQYMTGSQAMPETTTGTLMDLGKQGALQGAYQAAGEYGLPLAARGIEAVVARPAVRATTRIAGPQAGAGLANALGVSLAPTPLPVMGTTIAGKTIPESLSQTMQPSTAKKLAQQAEHYLGGTFPGGPLRDLAAEQQAVTREIVADQAKEIAGGKILTNPNELPQNFDRAAAYLEGGEQKLRNQVAAIQPTQTAQAAQGILNNARKLGLNQSAKDALNALGMTSWGVDLDNLAQGLHFNSVEQAINKLGRRTFESAAASAGIPMPAGPTYTATMGQAIAARDALEKLVGGDTTHPAYGALQQVNRLLNADLGTAGQAAVAQADSLARQQMISREMSAHLTPMYLASDPKAAPQIAGDAFGKMVNDMRNLGFAPTKSGAVAVQSSKLEELYPGNSPQALQNRQTWVDLASWFKRAGATQAGRSGVGEGFARIGAMFMAGRAAEHLLTGNVTGAVELAAPLVGMHIMSHALANPAGVQLVRDYFRAGGSKAAGPIAARIIAMATGVDPWKSGQAAAPMPPPAAFEHFQPQPLAAHAPAPQPTPAPIRIGNAREYFQKKGLR